MSKIQNCERAIKAKVLERLRQSGRFGPNPIIASEYCIGQTGVRADLVIGGRGANREVAAVEIKSASDSLRRLPNQLASYSKYFDRVIVVAAHRHQEAIRQILLPGLEIWEVEKAGTLSLVRPGQRNLSTQNLDELITQRDRNRYRGLLSAGPEGIRDAFFATLEDRYGQSSTEFWRTAPSRSIPSAAVMRLSRFEHARHRVRSNMEIRDSMYASWGAHEPA